MEYSPKLRRIADEFRKTAEGENVTMLLCLHDEKLQMSEFVNHLTHKHNIIRLEDTEDGKVYVRMTTKDILTSRVKKIRTENTVNMIYHFHSRCNQWGELFLSLIKQLKKHMEIEEQPGQQYGRNSNQN